MADDERCATCRFFIALGRIKGDRCRRYPPSVQGVYAQVSSEGWCGEWAPQSVAADDGEARA